MSLGSVPAPICGGCLYSKVSSKLPDLMLFCRLLTVQQQPDAETSLSALTHSQDEKCLDNAERNNAQAMPEV